MPHASSAPALTDDKVLASWNALALRAFAKAGATSGPIALKLPAAMPILAARAVPGPLARLLAGAGAPNALTEDYAGWRWPLRSAERPLPRGTGPRCAWRICWPTAPRVGFSHPTTAAGITR